MRRTTRNRDFQEARRAKMDEFYTSLSDIEIELKHYTSHFEDKVVYCNCDDPRSSNFFRYFSANFEKLGHGLLTPVLANKTAADGATQPAEEKDALDAARKSNPELPATKTSGLSPCLRPDRRADIRDGVSDIAPQDVSLLAEAVLTAELARTRQLLGACSHPAIPETEPQQTEPHPETARP